LPRAGRAPNPGRALELATGVKAIALALGFDRVGIASPDPSAETRFLRDWIARGYAGDMDYLVRGQEERVDPVRLLPGVRSVVVLALAHDPPPAEDAPCSGARGVVASYAGGEDYHDIMLDRVRAVAAGMQALAEHTLRSRCYVDTGPVLERVFAARAGIGWRGKNSLLIDTELGSRLLLGVVLSDLDLALDAPEPDHCGTCRACLDACPTDAFAAPYVLDATRCIAYTTIESRDAIPAALRASQADRVFGCDVCQDVCPWNRKRQAGDLPDPLVLRERLAPRKAWALPGLGWILSLDEPDWLEASRGTALRRAGRRGLIRNALVAAGNARDPELRPLLERHAAGSDPLLAEHARWALERLDDAR
jgi:epoxyqueuosine reductase